MGFFWEQQECNRNDRCSLGTGDSLQVPCVLVGGHREGTICTLYSPPQDGRPLAQWQSPQWCPSVSSLWGRASPESCPLGKWDPELFMLVGDIAASCPFLGGELGAAWHWGPSDVCSGWLSLTPSSRASRRGKLRNPDSVPSLRMGGHWSVCLTAHLPTEQQ